MRGKSRSSKSSSTEWWGWYQPPDGYSRAEGNSPNSKTPSPAELLHGRLMKTALPAIFKHPHNNEAVRASLQSRQDFCRYDAQAKERFTLLPAQPVWVQDSTSYRWSHTVVKSKAATPRSYIVEMQQGEYRRKRIHLKKAAVHTTITASTTSVVPKVRVKSIHQHDQDVQSVPIAPTQESRNNNKGNSNVSAQCVPNPQSTKVMEKAETKEQRRSSRPHKPNRDYI